LSVDQVIHATKIRIKSAAYTFEWIKQPKSQEKGQKKKFIYYILRIFATKLLNQ